MGGHRSIGAWIAGTLGLLIVVGLVQQLGADTLALRLRALRPEILWMVAAYLAGTAVVALPFRWLMPAAHRPSVGEAVVSRVVASGLNAVIPGMGILGEPSRILWVRRPGWPAGVAAMLVDRVLFAAVSLLALAGAILLALALPRLGADHRRAAPLVAAGLVALGLGGAALARGAVRRGLLRRGLGQLERTLRTHVLSADSEPSSSSGLTDFSEAADDALQTLLKTPGSHLAALGLVHLLGRLLLAAELFVGLLLLGGRAEPAAALLLALLPVIVSIAGAAIPGQLGLQEAAQVVVCRLVGVDPAVGLLVVLLQRARQLLVLPLAAALVAARLRQLVRRGPPG